MMSGGNPTENITNSFQTPHPPSSSFTFDLNALPKPSADFPQQQSFPPSNVFNSFSFSQPPSFNAVNGSPSFNATNEAPVNWINRQSFPNEPSQVNTQINSFSFNSQNVAAAPAPAFFSGMSQTPVAENNPCYSKTEELSADQVQAFQAPTFKYGYIPLQPPSKELCSKLSY